MAKEYLIMLGQTSLMLRSKVWLTQLLPLQYLKPSAKTKCPYPSLEKMFKAFWRQPPFCNAALPKSWHQIFCCPKLTQATHSKVCLCILADLKNTSKGLPKISQLKRYHRSSGDHFLPLLLIALNKPDREMV